MIDVKALKARLDILAVIGSYTQLSQRGSEWSGLCPLHDESTASFYVNPDKGAWNCFGCGDGGDTIEFIQLYHNCTFMRACEILQEGSYIKLPASLKMARPEKQPDWSSEPPPVGNVPASFEVTTAGKHTLTYDYLDADGALLGYVCRYDVDKNGEAGKTFRQWTYGHYTNSEARQWAVQHFSKPRPLYRLDVLTDQRKRKVIVTEGEKACDAAQQFFPGMVCTTWPGGSNAVQVANWAPLYGRTIILFPDADVPGREAMQSVAALLASHGCEVSVVDDPSKPKGWDIADGLADGWVPDSAMAWAKEFKKDYTPTAPKQIDKIRILKDSDAVAEEGDEAAVPPAFSDHAVAASAAVSFGQNWRYIAEWGQWFEWNKYYWKPDKTSRILSATRDHCCVVANQEQGSLLTESARRSLTSVRSHSNIEKALQYDQSIAVTTDQMNVNQWVLSTPTGTVDLRTGELHPAEREHMQTQCTSVSPGGDCPRWLSFLTEIMDGDIDMIDYLQRLSGYCLTGSTREEMLGFCFGEGANGKSVFLRTLNYVMGEYAATASVDIFSESEQMGHKNVLARLDKKRLVLANETEEGKKWAESRIKCFTSGENIQANFMRMNEFEFRPTMKLIFAGNHKPAMRSVGVSMRRRVQIIPFRVCITEDRRDRDLEDKLKLEGSGILSWMINGCVEWQRIGLLPPETVMAATDEYLEAEDSLSEWLELRCRMDKSHAEMVGTLYKDYIQFCKDNDESFPWSKKRFVESLKSRGCERGRFTNGVRCLRGIGLRVI